MLEGYFRIIGSFLHCTWYLDKGVIKPSESLLGEGEEKKELRHYQLFKINSFFWQFPCFTGPATLTCVELKSDIWEWTPPAIMGGWKELFGA